MLANIHGKHSNSVISKSGFKKKKEIRNFKKIRIIIFQIKYGKKLKSVIFNEIRISNSY